LAPLGESSGAVEFEIVSAVEGAFLIEMVVDGRMNCGELLQTSHLPEAEHRTFSSSKWQVRILGPIVQPAAGLLPTTVPDNFHRGTIRSQFVRHYHFWVAVSLH
jgi:hypothetical protein